MDEENSLKNLLAKVSAEFGEHHNFYINISDPKNVSKIKKELKKLAKFVDDKSKSLASIGALAINLLVQYEAADMKQFQSQATAYFKEKLGAKSVSFKDKTAGDQFGSRIIVQFEDEQEIEFHGKTHRGGQRSKSNVSTQPVDLKELLIYKVLELSGLGVEAHFFYDDINNFYIATKDAGYDDVNKKPREFMTYEKMREKESSDDLLKKDFIVDGFIQADIFSRLLLLSDVTTNGTNFGVSSNKKFKIIDFNPPLGDNYLDSEIYEEWLSANGRYNYTDETVIKILTKNKEEKIKATTTE